MESGLFRVLDRTLSYGRITTPAKIGPLHLPRCKEKVW
jgi:hypothetical protein